MAVLITIKPIRLNGTMVQTGEMIRIEVEQGLIDKGYARRFTKEEAAAIVKSYVEYAEKVFSNPMPGNRGKKIMGNQSKIQVK